MRKMLSILFVTLFCTLLAQGQKHSTFYEQCASLFELLPISTNDIVFVGNSIINGGEWNELFDDVRVKNRGISGDKSEGIYDRLSCIIEGKPQKIFFMIGINDIASNIPIDTTLKRIENIVLKVKNESPRTFIYLQSLLPVNPDFKMFSGHMKPDSIKRLNEKTKTLAHKHQLNYIDLYSQFVVEGTDKLSPEYTNDGLHLLGKGYIHWASLIKSYIKEQTMNTTIEKLPNYPIAGGVSAPFAGISNDYLLVAGGCNFPNIPASEGGEKIFYGDIFYLNLKNKNNEWIKAGQLPYPCAYGTYVSFEDGIVCIGGQNAEKSIDSVIRIRVDTTTQIIKTEQLPSLPTSLSNAGATSIGRKIYVAGGIALGGKRNDALFVLHLDDLESGWKTIRTNQDYERQQAVVFSQDRDLFMAGGYDESNAIVFTDVLKFDFSENRWHHYTDILVDGKSQTFIGTASLNVSPSVTLFAGGVDSEIFLAALKRIKMKHEAMLSGNKELIQSFLDAGKTYMTQVIEWYNFSSSIILFDARNKEWQAIANYPQLARAGAAIAKEADKIYVIGGEVKPGIRSETVTSIELKSSKF